MEYGGSRGSSAGMVMIQKSLQEEFYRGARKDIGFILDSEDMPGYHVSVGRDRFYIPSEILPQLTCEEYSTEDVRKKLEAFNPLIYHILHMNNVSYADLHIALLKVRNKELEGMVRGLLQRES